jgi:glycosyltransferase involved in cell wall biosynthesis
MIIEQFLPAFHYGDAIGNSTLRLHEFLVSQGIESRIIALTIDDGLEERAVLFKNYQTNLGSIKILHFAIPSELTDYFLQVKGRKVMIYHNITPGRFFVDFSSDLVRFTNAGREHLKRLKDCFDLNIADSDYNASELTDLNYKNVNSFPIMINLDQYKQEHSQAYYDLIKDERKNIIFVGRVTPNKKIEDLIKIIFFYKKFLNPSIRLIIAGNTGTLPKYYQAVEDLAARFLLTNDDVFFTGHIPFEELLSVYRLGDLFMSMSEHEGFCLPLIESCFFRIPVIAYNAGAVADTLDNAGLLVNEKNVEEIAALAENILNDEKAQKKLKNLQKERIESYLEQSNPAILLNKLREI